MTQAASPRNDIARAALRFALAAPAGLLLTAIALAASTGDPAAPGGGSAACAVMMRLPYPWSWWAFVALAAALAAFLAFALDRVLARLVGGPGRRASVGLALALLVLVVVALATPSVGVFC